MKDYMKKKRKIDQQLISVQKNKYLTFRNIFLHRTTTPLLFGQLLLYWSVNSMMTRETATAYAVSMIAANWVAAFLNHHGNLYCQQFGMKLRIAVSSLMYRKV
jgi:hypothetical protein